MTDTQLQQLKCVFGFFGLAIAGSIALAAERTAEEWIESMNTALHELNYEGILSYFDGEELTTLRYRHSVVDGEEHESVLHLNGPNREFVRSGEQVSLSTDPDDELYELKDRLNAQKIPSTFHHRFDALDDTYSLKKVGLGRIANRPAVRISVTPKTQDRYGFHLWIDHQTSLLLRSEMRDENQRMIDVMQFTDIQTTEVQDPSGNLSFSGAQDDGLVVQQVPERVAPDISQIDWRPEWVPTGFSISAADVGSHDKGEVSFSYVSYSDGLVAFSVFVEPTQENEPPIENRSGSTFIVSHTTNDSEGNLHVVTVAGDLPKQTVLRIARGVRPAP